MRSLSAPFLIGIRDSSPFVIVIIPFAMLFGVVASEAGWSLAQIMAMSVLVIAGAAQFTALQLISENAPLLVVIATSLAVNLRLAMYSASLAVHLGPVPLPSRAAVAYVLTDQTYACAMNRWALGPPMSLRQKVAYFIGSATPMAPVWYGFTWVGAVAGDAIPSGLALDFAIPITFIAMVAPMLRDRPQVAAAVSAAGLSLLLAGLPYSLGILIAGGAGMAVGAASELRRERQA